MSVQPCGTVAGMMTMSPGLTTRLTTSSPAITPLHDGPFNTLVTSLSGADLRPFTIWPPVTRVPLPERMTYVSVWWSWEMPPATLPDGGVLACSPHAWPAAAGAGFAGAAPRPAAAAFVGPR